MKTLLVKRQYEETAEIELSDEEYEKFCNGDIDFCIFDIIGETDFQGYSEISGQILDPDKVDSYGRLDSLYEWEN